MSFVRAFVRENRPVRIDWSIFAAIVVAVCLLAGVFIQTDGSDTSANGSLSPNRIMVLGDGDTLVTFENFEYGPSGWEGGQIDNSAPGFGSVLGTFGGTGGLETIRKTFQLTEDHEFALIEFDLHAIDDWQLEELNVFINGAPIATQSFSTMPNLRPRQSLHLSDDPQLGITVTEQDDPPIDRGYGEAEDQTMAFRIVVDDPGSTLAIGFGSNLLPENTEAFWAVDNLRITATDKDPD